MEPKTRLTVEEYLAQERQAETKSEYLNGEVFAMTGFTRAHSLIVGNVGCSLHEQLRKRSYEAYISAMRVLVLKTGLFTYPDVVVASEPSFDDEAMDNLLNPTLIVEVLSESTEDYDRGTKFAHYRTIPSLSEYVLIAQSEVHVEHFIRQADGWLLTETSDLGDTIELPSIGCRLSLKDVYERVIAPAC